MYQQLKQKKFSKLPFKLTLAATAICGVMSANVFAAEEADDEDDVEVIEVRGVRGNMMKAQDMKREGDTFLDAISAADIGSLPDRSVLEAISRVPGVSIERFAGANDPDHFGVEGSGVVVRGLTHVRSEFNGRDTFTADSGRGLSFQDVPPELMGSVEVFKNQTADMIEGGIAGTVNLITRKPFDTNERIVAFSVDATYADFIKETTPSFSALYSDVFDTDAGKFGVLTNFAHSELKAQSDGTQMGLYQIQDADNTKFVPKGSRLTRKQDDRKRQGFALAVQWESPDETIVATGEYIRSDSQLAWTENAIEMDDDDAHTRKFVDPRGTEFGYDNNGLFENGIIATNEGWRGTDATRDPGGLFGARQVAITRSRDQEALVEDFGLNVKITPTDNLEINLDAQYIDSTSEILDFSVAGGTRATIGINRTGSGIAKVDFYPPSYDGGDVTVHTGKRLSEGEIAEIVFNPEVGITEEDLANAGQDLGFFQKTENYFHRHAMDHISDNEGNELAFQADVKYSFDEGFFTSVKAGARYSSREQTTRQSTYQWKVISERWSGSQAWFNEHGEDLYEAVEFDNFGRSDVLNVVDSQKNEFLFPSRSFATNYGSAQEKIDGLNQGSNEWAPLALRKDSDGNIIPKLNTHFTQPEVNDTEETSTALYVMANFESEVGDFAYMGNFGLRYVKLENDTRGYAQSPDDRYPEGANIKPIDPNAPDDESWNHPYFTNDNVHLNANQSLFGQNQSYQLSSASDYDVFLPSFNLKIDLHDDVILRLGYSKAIALPDLGLLRNYVNISGDKDSATKIISDKEIAGVKNPQTLDDGTPVVDDAGNPVNQRYTSYKEYTRYTADSGNPKLKPMESDNYDLSVEWYFSEAGSLTTSLFYKNLSNYFIKGVEQREYTFNGITQTVDVSSSRNGDKGKVQGIEFAYNQFFDFLPGDWSGLGMQFNYTYIDEEGSPNANLSNDSIGGNPSPTFENLPLEGLSNHNYNIVAMYEKNGWNARLAYNWRSDYLLTTQDVITKLPIYNEDMGQVDGSVSYEIDDNWTVSLQGVNLTNAEVETSMQYNENGDTTTRAWFVNDRRYTLAVKANF